MQAEEPPTACPLLFRPNIKPFGSPWRGGSSWGTPLSHRTGLASYWRLEHVLSRVAFSAYPPTNPKSLIAPAMLLLPPSVGSGDITPFRQMKPRQISCVPKRQKSVPNGSGAEVSE